MGIWLLDKAKPPQSFLVFNVGLKEFEITTVIGRSNGQNVDWTLPGSGIIWESFDTGVGNFCCGEGTSGGILLCVYVVHPCQCHDGATLILMQGIFLLML